jgi:predicted TIM-barrel fold metal-dependent hydrolase
LEDKTHLKEPRPEAVLEHDLPICDAHHHLWEYPGNVYLGRELIEDIDGHNIVQTVVVEAWPRNIRSGGKMKEPAEETALAVAESNSNPGRTRIASGIIGYADLMAGRAVEKVIESHIIAGQGRFRGVRPAPGSVLADRKFLEGCSVIDIHNLVIDVAVHSQQLLELVGLAAKYPETPIMKPWYFYCIERFGADRCMLESNFPVDKRSFSYNVHWNAAKRLTENLSPAERNSLFYTTAVEAYRL